MKKKLHTQYCKSPDDIRKFFDTEAQDYQEAHGDAQRLLDYRLQLIRKFSRVQKHEVLLDVGCGTGQHLFGLAPSIEKGIGIDFSVKMIEKACDLQKKQPAAKNLVFRIDEAQSLQTVADETVDVVLCVGSFEHIPQKEQVLRQMNRVLRTKGRLLLFTPNGNFLWYRFLAHLFRFDTRHLSSDEFVTANWLKRTLKTTGYDRVKIDFWTFIPKGDMPKLWALILTGLDLLGKILLTRFLRSGLMVRADKIG
jgi:SAM-dependent methyltransferase